jgi:hypothetical protein
VRLDNNDINITQKLKERNTMTEKETIRLAYELSLDDYEKNISMLKTLKNHMKQLKKLMTQRGKKSSLR